MRSGSIRLLACTAAVALAAAATAVEGGSASQGGFAFGRSGGNIRPYTVTIAAGGAVHTSGPVTVGQRHLSATKLAALRRLAQRTGFSTLPLSKSCAGALPDVASTFIRVGSRTVRVHGSCLEAYNRFWLALTRAVGLSGMT